MTIDEAADRLEEHLKEDNNVTCIGIREEKTLQELIIYIKKQINRKYPTDQNGYPVRTVVIGEIKVEVAE